MTATVSTMRFLIEIISILKAMKSYLNGSYNKQNLTLVAISLCMKLTKKPYSVIAAADTLEIHNCNRIKKKKSPFINSKTGFLATPAFKI